MSENTKKSNVGTKHGHVRLSLYVTCKHTD